MSSVTSCVTLLKLNFDLSIFFMTPVIVGMSIESKRDTYMVVFNRFKYDFASKNVRRVREIRCRRVKRTCSAAIDA